MALSCVLATTTANAGANATWPFNLNVATVQGQVIVVCQSGDNGGSAVAVSMTTPTMPNETFIFVRLQNYDPGAIRAGNTLGIYYCVTTRDHVSTDQITLNHVATDRTTAVVWVLDSTESVGLPRIGASIGFNSTGGTTGASGTSGTTTSASLAVGDIIIGVTSTQDRVAPLGTPDADTTNGSWSAQQSIASDSGTALTSMVISSQWKLVTGAGTQTYNTGWVLSTTFLLGYAVFRELGAPREGAVNKLVLPSMHRAAVR